MSDYVRLDEAIHLYRVWMSYKQRQVTDEEQAVRILAGDRSCTVCGCPITHQTSLCDSCISDWCAWARSCEGVL